MTDKKYEIHTIEKNGKKYYLAHDVAHILKYEGGYHLTRLSKKHGVHDIEYSDHMTGAGIRPMLYISEQTLKFILAKSQKTEALDLATYLGYEILLPTASPERHIMKNISNALPHLGLLQQYRIGKYRVDGYSKLYNLIIECDENDHKQYDQIEEAKRTASINLLLDSPKWIRFNPKDDIFKTIGRIYTATIDPKHDFIVDKTTRSFIESD